MNTFRKIWLTAMVAATLVSILPASAAVTWDEVKNKIKQAKSYTVDYDYDGPQGQFEFDYRYSGGWNSPDKIRTEITDSKSDRSRRGTVIVYDKGWNADKIRAKTGGGMIVRNLTHNDVQGRPFHQSLFQMIFDQLGGATPKVYPGKETRFVFRTGGGEYTIWANENAEIVKTERKDGRENEVRELSNYTWNGSPSMGF